MNKNNLISKIFILILLTSCSNGAKQKFGFTEQIPNEYSVIRNKPLIIPPFYERSNSNNLKNEMNPVIKTHEDTSYGEKLLLNKIDNNYSNLSSPAIIHPKKKKTDSFFKRLFKKNDYSKDATKDPEANLDERPYNSQSRKIINSENLSSSNRKICNVNNGEVVYCDKNMFMKNFSITPND